MTLPPFSNRAVVTSQSATCRPDLRIMPKLSSCHPPIARRLLGICCPVFSTSCPSRAEPFSVLSGQNPGRWRCLDRTRYPTHRLLATNPAARS